MVLALTMVAGCAVSPEVEERRRAAEAEVEEILSLSVDGDGESLAQDCLRRGDSRYIGALGGHHIVFATRGGGLWVNTLRSLCMDLEIQPSAPIAIDVSPSGRICRSDLFYPHLIKEPPPCLLGEFVPVSADQLAEIKAALERKKRCTSDCRR